MATTLNVDSLPEVVGVDNVTEILQKAVQYYQANRLTEAEKAYRQVLEIQPDHPEAFYGLGILSQKMGNHQAAEQLLSKALQFQPDSVKIWFTLGNLRQSQEQLSEAANAYHQALKLQPDSAPIYNNLGFTLQQQGLFDEAINYYRKALELKRDFMEAEANLGNALHAQGKLSSEQKLYYAKLNNKLAIARKKAGDLKTTVAYYRQAISLQPDQTNTYLKLGMTLHEQGQVEEAESVFYQALELKSDGEKAYLTGLIYQIQHQLDKAVSAYRKGLMLLNPHYAQAVSSSSSAQVSVFNLDEHIPPPIQFQETIIGKYSFPTIPPVPNSEEARPFWSVVIPVLNRPEYFPECLASVLAQWTGPEDMEILVLDNGSNPPLFEIPHGFGKGMIRYYRFPKTVPLQQNWNTAVALSRGQWIHLLHHDDYVLPGFYARLKASLEKCSESIGAAFTGYENIDENREVVFSQEHGLKEYRGVVKDWVKRIGVSCPLSPPSVVIRRLAYEKLGGYKLDLPYTCDWEFYKRVAVFYDWWYEPGILAHYRQHSNSVTVAETMDGSCGAAHRRAIEMSQSYLPVESCAAITAKSRTYHFEWCLSRAVIPLKFGNLEGALQLIQEALKIDDSPESIRKLFVWLTANELAPIRQQIVSRCIMNFSNNCLK
ncbi:MAG: tetratricopeptide repeat protein [Mojavia pulchra JT2-VF2]|jgi:tetratricopeptide (TPR) repeat protein|uniref:Tetratricopeptide repeat protein n=1 Tax=Mojavia pulchra JT2-VF2 TaxID=287848 RepID=A0A951Q5Z6_9NOST|nr:tetratricopeptide repeat protein [Mojavia pulchra JT2-VF2]